MPKSLQIYLSKLKKFADPAPKSPSGCLLSACKYPKTPSFAIDRSHKGGGEAATLKDIDQFLSENFKSLYQDEEECSIKSDESMVLCESPTFAKTLPSLDSPRRFFVPTGEASSLIDEAGSSSKSSSFVHDVPCTSSSSTSPKNDEDDDSIKFPSDTFAMLQYSSDPYSDFRRSMVEVVAAHEAKKSEPLDWDYFEKLLFSYLSLNEKKAHKYVLGAFVDLMAGFRPDSGEKLPAIRERRKKKVRVQKGREVINGEGQRSRKNR